MVIMALDHVRDFFSYSTIRPNDPTKTSALLFFTRWITHLCAPTFVFLSGISIYLYYKKMGSLKKTSRFLATRGLWLIAVEIFVISFIITQGYQLTLLEVIWAIGCSMLLLAGLIFLPRWLQITLALAMILGHDALPPVGQVSVSNIVFALLHNIPFFIDKPAVLVSYTIVPWVGVMLLGYAIGPWFNYEPAKRDQLLLRSGIAALVLFIVLRFINVYGDPVPWAVQPRGSVYTFLSFLNISKYPPSLLFLSATLGIACLLLVFLNKIPAALQQFCMVYGKVPFFYFILHLAVTSLGACLWTYFAFGKAVNLSFENAANWPPAYHPNLGRAYFVWALVVLLLYYPCRWYGRYKAKSKAWWVSYL